MTLKAFRLYTQVVQQRGLVEMTCFFCKGKFENGLTTDVTDLGTCVIVIRNVPCRKCTQCGETTISLDVGEQLERFVDARRKSDSELTIVQYAKVAA